MDRSVHRRSSWIGWVAVLLFAVHAASYLYFFVDDEAIPFVYAQNVLHGKGLIYTVLEGRVEGYSDFLHVWIATLLLAIVRSLQLPKYAVFFAGKALSIACGLAIVALVGAILRRPAIERSGAAAGLAFLALAPPLAVWSCSSLETVPFALMTTVLAAALIAEADGWAAAASAILLLQRIDGFVYAGALVGAFLLTAPRGRRRALVLHVIVPMAVTFAGYHAWRALYFRELLPAPLRSKILYKLTPHSNLVVKAPDAGYSRQFIRMYGWPAVVGAIAAAALTFRAGGAGRRVLFAVVPLVAYVSVVGDWMFGFRFFVPILPLLAIVIAAAVGEVGMRRPRVGIALAVAVVVYCGFVAGRFVDLYRTTQPAGSFLRTPSRDLHRYFWPYYGLYESARKLVRPGVVVAYNQAGFLPFMLDVSNIDDLGICSRFYADLPTTDLYFTEVGRYAPLTNQPALRASDAYLLYRRAQFVLARTDILRRANHDTIPPELFGGYYALVEIDRDGENAIYRRTEKDARVYETDPRAFEENVAHVSYLRRATVDGVEVPPAAYQQRMAFLRDATADLTFTRRQEIAVDFAEHDEQVRELSIEAVRASQSATLGLTLATGAGAVVYRSALQLVANESREVLVTMPAGLVASHLTIELSSSNPGSVRVSLTNLRVQGQTTALQRYILRRLQFPAPAPQ